MGVPFLNIKLQLQEIYPGVEQRLKGLFEDCKFILGPYVREFEEKFEKMMKAEGTALGVASGTDALILALKSLDIKKDDEVIVPAYTFIATADAVIHAGGKPVFADILPDHPNISPKSIEEKITDKTIAIVVVHLYGEAADMDSICAIAKKHNLMIIEDVAQATGLKINGKYAGSFGEMGAFSFYPTKNLGGAGDGGLIFVNRTEYIEKLRLFRDHGRLTGYAHDIIGYNSRLDAMQAIVLSANIEFLEKRNSQRQKLAENYKTAFKDIKDITLPEPFYKNGHVYNLFTIRTKKRELLMNTLKEKGIGFGIYYPIPLHLQPCLKYLGNKKGDFPISEKWAEEALSIPLFPGMKDSEQQEIIDVIKNLFE